LRVATIRAKQAGHRKNTAEGLDKIKKVIVTVNSDTPDERRNP
jgi:hypothetical protein